MLKSGNKIGWLEFSKEDIKYYLLVFFFILLIMWGVGIYQLLNSDEYAFAKNYVSSDSKIVETLGEVRSIRPAFINSKRSYSGGVWHSKFEIIVEGEKKSATIFFALRSSENGWVVEEQKIVE